jgi:hypothetical protein
MALRMEEIWRAYNDDRECKMYPPIWVYRVLPKPKPWKTHHINMSYKEYAKDADL